MTTETTAPDPTDPDAALVAPLATILSTSSARAIYRTDPAGQMAPHWLIEDDGQGLLAQDILQALDERIKYIEEWFKEPVDAAFKAHRILTGRRSKAVKAFADIRQDLALAIGRYAQQQRRLKEEADRKAAAEASAKEQERLLAEAASLETAGDKELAEAVLQEAAAAPMTMAPVRSAPVAQRAGIDLVERVDFEVVNKDLLPRAYTLADTAAIRHRVKADGLNTRIPGVRVFTVTGVRNRG